MYDSSCNPDCHIGLVHISSRSAKGCDNHTVDNAYCGIIYLSVCSLNKLQRSGSNDPIVNQLAAFYLGCRAAGQCITFSLSPVTAACSLWRGALRLKRLTLAGPPSRCDRQCHLSACCLHVHAYLGTYVLSRRSAFGPAPRRAMMDTPIQTSPTPSRRHR